MCYEYEWEYMLQRAEDARKALEKAAQEQKPKPAAPAPAPKTGQEEPVPV